MTDKEKLELVMPYLKDMAERGDDEAKVLLRVVKPKKKRPYQHPTGAGL